MIRSAVDMITSAWFVPASAAPGTWPGRRSVDRYGDRVGDPRWPVSIKGVVLARGHVLLARNERDEWELPGGRLEPGERPERCVVREIEEEAGIGVVVDRIIDSWVYPVLPDRQVLIVTYRCIDLDGLAPITISAEHRDVRWVPLDGVGRHPMPEGYRRSIDACT